MHTFPPATTQLEERVPTLDDWNVIRKIGSGTTAQVWLVESQQDRSIQAALRLVSDSGSSKPSDQGQADVGETLKHPHIASFLDKVATSHGSGQLWEYYPGGSLTNLMSAAGRLNLGQVVTILVPIAQALAYGHDRGIVHGDISPSNILFTISGKPVVCDYSEARVLGGQKRQTGTQGFYAPELDSGADNLRISLQPTADMYSIGALGWFCLTGRVPPTTRNRAPLSLLASDASPDVAQLLERCLDEDPQVRPTPEEFAVSCFQWAEPESLDLFPAVTPEIALHLPTRKPAGGAVQKPRKRRRRGVTRAHSTGPTTRGVLGRKALLRLGTGLCCAGLGTLLISTSFRDSIMTTAPVQPAAISTHSTHSALPEEDETSPTVVLNLE